MRPLDGILVLEIASFQAAAAGYQLGDLGADVIKIEDTIQGDGYRGMTRMYGDAMSFANGRHVGFETANRNARGITLNLKSEKGREIFYQLVEKADVLFTNSSEEVLARLGADYDTLSARNPQIIYAMSNGFGPNGSWSGRRGFDQIAQARSGLMYAMGDRDFDEPVQTVGGICDQMAATMIAYGVLAALVARNRHGVGQKVNVSLYGSALHLQAVGINVASLRGRAWSRHSRKRVRNPLTNHYRCGDGKWILLAEAQADRYWPQFCQALEITNLKDNPKFDNIEHRRENYQELIKVLDEAFAKRSQVEWVKRFDDLGTPIAYSPIQDYGDVLNDPQSLQNNYIIEVDHSVAGPVKEIGFPVQFSKTPASVTRDAPEFGQHTEEVLNDILGIPWEDLANLKDLGVI